MLAASQIDALIDCPNKDLGKGLVQAIRKQAGLK